MVVRRRVCAVHFFPVAYVPPHLRKKSSDYQRRDDFERQEGGGRSHGQWRSYGECWGRSGVGEVRVVSAVGGVGWERGMS